MKIYATHKKDLSIADFAGKNVWVRCEIDDMTHPYYVNLIKVTSYTMDLGYLHWFPATYVDNPQATNTWGQEEIKSKWIDYVANILVSDIHILFPLDILTTEELCDIMGIPL